MRWVAAFIAAIVGVLLVLITVGFVPDYVSDKSHADKATFLGTILGSIALIVLILQFLGWLRRRGSRDSIAMRLRIKLGKELDRRLRDMRRTAEDIALTYRTFGDSEKTDLNGLIDIILNQSGRVVLTGQPGVGKSYTALQVAAALIRRDPSIVPLVVPLSRWTGTEEPERRLARFLEDEYNVAALTASELIDTGTVVPIFDGLDELGSEEDAAELLGKLVDWRILGSRAPFFLTSLRSTWDGMDAELTSHHALAVYSILAVGAGEARQYLIYSLGGPGRTGMVSELIGSLQGKGHGHLLATPFPLSLIAEIFVRLLKQPDGMSASELEQITDSVTVDNLIAYYVESARTNKRIIVRLRRTLDFWWLSHYAEYLMANEVQMRIVAGRAMPARDLVLHRLWPIAGDRLPRMVDLAMCVILSIPGFYWAGVFLWHRGLPARVLLVIFGLIWVSLLVRTSTKPWVRSASPNWSRLANPRFFLRQLGAATLIGLAAWLIVSPVAGAVCFVTAWLGIGFTVGFGQTLATDREPRVIGPLGVLRRERQVSLVSAGVVFPVLAAGFSATWGVRIGVGVAFVYCLVVGETVACALWRRYLAMIIASLFRLPPDPARFMERMHAHGYLRIAGVSYQFRHEGFRRYFAQRTGLRGQPNATTKPRWR
jgi:hypothetical protein